MTKTPNMKTELYNYKKKNPNEKKPDIVRHFMKMGYARRTVYSWFESIENGDSLERKKGSGRPARIATADNIRKIKKIFNHRSGCSQRRVAMKLNCSQPYVSMMLRKHTNIRCRKKSKKPQMSEVQKQKARPKARKMLEKYKSLDFIIDDESYFTLAHSSQPGNDRFYSSDIDRTPEDVKHRYQSKYEQKLLVWICISPKGASKPYFLPSGMAINQDVYLNQIVKRFLEPFIEEHYKPDEYVFWPDLASAHYAKAVTNYLSAKKINFVPKAINPANVPKCRPIEDFWANLKRMVYEGDWTAKNLDELKKKIRATLNKIDFNLVQSHASSVPKRLDHLRRYGA